MSLYYNVYVKIYDFKTLWLQSTCGNKWPTIFLTLFKIFFLFKRKTTFLCSRTLAAAMLRLYSFSQKFANIYGLFNLPFFARKT